MYRKIILALVAAAALSAPAVAPTAAFAGPGPVFQKPNPGLISGSPGFKWSWKQRYLQQHYLQQPKWSYQWRPGYRPQHYGPSYAGPRYYGPRVTTLTPDPVTPTPAGYAPRTASGSCLTKEYLQDGSVLFKDLCTQEQAIAPAAQSSQYPAPQVQ